MAYTEVKTDAVKAICDDWFDRAGKLKDEREFAVRQRLQGEMTTFASQIETRLDRDMGIIENGFAQHQATVARLAKEAENFSKSAKQAAARFKAKPDLKELPPQVTHFAKQIGDRATAIFDDAHDYGDSWKTYRSNPWATPSGGVPFPNKHTNDFMTRRNVIINDQKAVGTTLEKVRALHREAESLALIINKAALKRDIKAGTGAQRPITEARKIAKEGSAKIKTMYADLVSPNNLQPKPDSVTQNANTLAKLVADKNWPKDALAMKNYEGVWKNAEAGYKRIVTIEANMRTVAANVRKGLRSTEMKDEEVKLSLQVIDTDLKPAARLVKTKAPDYAKAKAAYPKVLAGHQALMKAKKK